VTRPTPWLTDDDEMAAVGDQLVRGLDAG